MDAKKSQSMTQQIFVRVMSTVIAVVILAFIGSLFGIEF